MLHDQKPWRERLKKLLDDEYIGSPNFMTERLDKKTALYALRSFIEDLLQKSSDQAYQKGYCAGELTVNNEKWKLRKELAVALEIDPERLFDDTVMEDALKYISALKKKAIKSK